MKWVRITSRRRLPKTGIVIAGSWRPDIFTKEMKWSTSGVSEKGYPSFADSDRTHYCRLPNPPKRT